MTHPVLEVRMTWMTETDPTLGKTPRLEKPLSADPRRRVPGQIEEG